MAATGTLDGREVFGIDVDTGVPIELGI